MQVVLEIIGTLILLGLVGLGINTVITFIEGKTNGTN